MFRRVHLALILITAAGATPAASAGEEDMETISALTQRIHAESAEAYLASPFSMLSRDYFARFVRDRQARPGDGEIAIDAQWHIQMPVGISPLGERMAGHLAEFLEQRMDLALVVETVSPSVLAVPKTSAIVLVEQGGGVSDVPESFTISVQPGLVRIAGRDAAGLRDGIARLVQRIGFRCAPILPRGEEVCRPRLGIRLGAVPWMGSYRDLVFLGYNAANVGGGSLYAISTSDAIPELAARRSPHHLASVVQNASVARQYGLHTYCLFQTRQKFLADDPIFAAHPEIRGAQTWTADGEYVLCTEHPLVRRYLTETVEGLFRADPQLDGLIIIIGGEGFYHCFMRPYGTPRGKTNCPRCNALGAEAVVANLCNALAGAARRANPNALVIAWPYSAEHVWSEDDAQTGFIRRLKPGTAIFTEIEKDEWVDKPGGVRKHLWDYSIDLIGPGDRAMRQIEACRAAGIPIFLKSEPELGYEAPRLAHIPCMDRWAARAEALASCGADGAFVFPAFRPCYGTSAAEVARQFWWDPAPDPDTLLLALAQRLFGSAAAPHMRNAWRFVSEAIAYSPELPPYYTGPYYLGPAHPMCADPAAPLPDVFYGYYLFWAEIADAEGQRKRPTFVTSPGGDVIAFRGLYRWMEQLLYQAVGEVGAARPLIDADHRLLFDAEAIPIEWFYRTVRTEANFYEACPLRDRLLALADQPTRTPQEQAEAFALYARWRTILASERENTQAALPLAEADVRLDFRYGGDHSFAHTTEMLRAKRDLLDRELHVFLPSVALRLGIETALH